MLFDDDIFGFLDRTLGRIRDVLLSQESPRDRQEILLILVGLLVLEHLASKGMDMPEPEKLEQLNRVIREAIGSGNSWEICSQFLSGERARMAVAEHSGFLEQIGMGSLIVWANLILPAIEHRGYSAGAAKPIYDAYREYVMRGFMPNIKKSVDKVNELVPGVFVIVDGEMIRIYRANQIQ
ncbi:hypothetical protein M3795_25240 [Ralstonia pickettii]|uniref:hypothetical protein n=1 Tax=Ralstonia pickettii TaxID=329 RepID=UPI002041BA2D|nr:hypothetical protein [Ralstonia pickettii]MCM3583779.1 hypothetical protein [Ralstonia pickettii]